MSEEWMIDPEGAFEIDGTRLVAQAIESAFRDHVIVRVDGVMDVCADDIAKRLNVRKYHRVGISGWLFQRPESGEIARLEHAPAAPADH